ncbi:MAG: hypothetical protein ACREHC_06995 [Candidatus Levyibacteriota bacterium]
MTKRQVDALALLFLDMGKLTFASLLLGFFQTKTDPLIVFVIGIFGLTFSLAFFILGRTFAYAAK